MSDASEQSGQRSALFVCLGNICRSPIAEAVFRDEVKKRNLSALWTYDSAATGDYHTGNQPEKRARATLEHHGITDYKHKARQVSTADFRQFDFIFAMDNHNLGDLRELQRLAGKEAKAELALLGDYDPNGEREVPDPYYHSGSALFHQVLEQCRRCCQAFLDKHP